MAPTPTTADAAATPLLNPKVILILGWVSLASAFVGGCAAVGTFLGDWIAAFVGIFPDWMAPTLFVLGTLATILDVLGDGTPNRPAVAAAILLPSVSQAVNGTAGKTVRGWGDGLSAWADTQLGALFGQGGLTFATALFIGIAVILARRVLKKSKANKAALGAAASARARAGL